MFTKTGPALTREFREFINSKTLPEHQAHMQSSTLQYLLSFFSKRTTGPSQRPLPSSATQSYQGNQPPRTSRAFAVESTRQNTVTASHQGPGSVPTAPIAASRLSASQTAPGTTAQSSAKPRPLENNVIEPEPVTEVVTNEPPKRSLESSTGESVSKKNKSEPTEQAHTEPPTIITPEMKSSQDWQDGFVQGMYFYMGRDSPFGKLSEDHPITESWLQGFKVGTEYTKRNEQRMKSG